MCDYFSMEITSVMIHCECCLLQGCKTFLNGRPGAIFSCKWWAKVPEVPKKNRVVI